MRNLLVTTTNAIEGKEIRKYFTPITAFSFTDTVSFYRYSFSEFFGGRDISSEQKLDALYQSALDDLISKAIALGANGIIGLHMESSQISGSGEMQKTIQLSLIGTPVSLANVGSGKIETIIDGKRIDDKVKAKRIINTKHKSDNIYDNVYNTTNLEFIARVGLPELLPIVLNGIEHYLDKERIKVGGDYAESVLKYLYQYFDNIKDEQVVLSLYDEFMKSSNVAYLDILCNVILHYGTIDLNKIKELLKHQNMLAGKYGLKLLKVGQSSYGAEDALLLDELRNNVIQGFPERARKTSIKKMFSSSEKEAWSCMCGEINDIESRYCKHCKNDTYGFSKEDVKPDEIIELLEGRISVIKEIND